MWVKVGGLWPLNTGGRLRTFEILSALSAEHDVSLVTTHGDGDDPQGLTNNLPRLARLVSLPYSAPKQGTAAFARALARSWVSADPVDLRRWRVRDVRDQVRLWLRDGGWDVVVADFLVAGANVPDTGRVPLVFFAHNVEHQIWRRLASVEARPWRRVLLELEARKMRQRERAMLRRASRTIAVSDVDRAAFLADESAASIEVVPTGVNTTYFRPGGAAPIPGRLVFCGSMDWYPNEDAMLDFVANVWPRLVTAVPGVSLTIVGRRPSPRVLELGREVGITVTGTVDDVRPEVAAAEVYIVPLRVGGGTRLKIFEALAMEKAVVSTTVGAEGLGLVDGEHYVAADSHADLAAAIERLLADAGARARIGARGRALVESEYAWPQVARRFAAVLGAAVVPVTRSERMTPAVVRHPVS
jgi:glycosyltransferase involved in cell wall biosynthesis